MGLQGKKLGLWDYTLFEIGLQKSALKLGLCFSNPAKLGFSIYVNWNYRISPYLKLGLWDYAGFEIGITGLQDLPYGGPTDVKMICFLPSNITQRYSEAFRIHCDFLCIIWFDPEGVRRSSG